MKEKFDLAQMLREIAEERTEKSSDNRALSQEEIKKRVLERRKPAAGSDAGSRSSTQLGG